ncbi:MAG: hypothetical protein M1828_000214 [Chrysothrix sp. TS-e1954]|nr:MAG: hypothetical protein M1828_000214 [Chrysothrix sp. TS-e1954]
MTKRPLRKVLGEIMNGCFGASKLCVVLRLPAPSIHLNRLEADPDLHTAINKPKDISSAQCLRDLQEHFIPSKLFAPSLDQMRNDRTKENRYQKRRRSKAKQEIRVKLGHGGTLDPMATGVLIVGVGNGTKELGNFLHGKKSYTTDVLFGAATDSFDTLGRVLKRAKTSHLSETVIQEALKRFRGEGKQRPPIYSALNQDGKRLYEYAREGKKPPREIELRDVNVKELELLRWTEVGEHGFKFPEQEAEPQEKEILNEVMEDAKSKHASLPSRDEQVEVEAEDGSTHPELKRKHDDPLNGTVFDASPAPKRRKESPEPTMSGAIQHEPHGNPDDSKAVGVNPDEKAKEDCDGGPVAKLHMSVSSGFYVRSLCQDLGEAVDSAAIMASLVRTQQADFKLGKNVFEYSELAKSEDVWAPQIKSLLDDWNQRQTPAERKDLATEND